MKTRNWITKKIKDMTIQDALEAQSDGIDFVCGNGTLKYIDDQYGRLHSIIRGHKTILNGKEV